MVRKISFFVVFALIISIIFSFTTNSNKSDRYKAYPIVNVVGNEPRNPNSKMFTGDVDAINYSEPKVLNFSDSISQITDTYMGITTLHDLQSNACTQYLVQWYKDTLHAVYMYNMTPGIPGAQRRTIYLTSTDAGATWDNLGEVPSGVHSGYAAIILLNDGRAVIGNHNETNALGAHSTIFHDLLPLGGTFTNCDPGGGLPGVTTRVWVRLTRSLSNKVSFVSAFNPTGGADTTTYTNALTNISNCTFSGWSGKPQMDNAEQYAIATAANGTIGLAYVTNGFTPSLGADIHYISSTDEGLTWSAPTVVFDCVPNPDDFLGGLRGIDLVFVGNTPKVTFDLVHQTDAGSYYPGFCSKIMFWSPNINGGNPVVIVDSTKMTCNGVVSGGAINDVYVAFCRGQIAKSRNEQLLYCVFSSLRTEVSPNVDSTPYADVYLAWSNNGGATWQGYNQLTNLSGPLRDCRYPCPSPVNDNDANFYYVNIAYQSDSIPGSAVQGAAESPARFRFLRVQMPSIIGIQNIGSEVPKNYSLFQNYPNPFNPTTKIRFALPSSEFVTLKVYDVTGREVGLLINEKLDAGVKEYEFNASELSSGVYFYELRAGDFKQTRKMVVLK
jgi:hypothetical protein